MHLFVIHQFPELDNYAPIIKTLSDKEKVIVFSIYPIHDFKKYKILNFLLKNNNVDYIEITSLSIKLKFLKLVIKILYLLPKILLNKINFFWRLIYYKNIFFSESLIEKLDFEKRISSINIDVGLPERYKKILSSFAIKNKKPIYMFRAGVDLRIDDNKLDDNTKFIYSDYGACEKIILQANHQNKGSNNEIYKKKSD